MNFVSRFLRAWREARTAATYDFMSDTEGGWTAEDAELMRALFGGPTGGKLKIRLTNYVLRCAVEATRQTQNHAYHNGIARGVEMAVNVIEEHMNFASPMRNKDTSDSQPSSVAERFGFN